MLSSFNTAISGLNNNAQAINVIGNNLANINTTGFKASKTSFAELLGDVGTTGASGNPMQVGLGSYVPMIMQINSQGSLNYTGRPTDVAISGAGFLVVSTGKGDAYTRAGNLSYNAQGEFITVDGYKVMGWPAVNGKIDTNTPLSPVSIMNSLTLAPRATSNFAITTNLDSRIEVDGKFTTSVQVIDSLGASHTLTIAFTKTGSRAWSWEATIPAVDTGGTATSPPTSIATGTFAFDSDGALTAPTTNPVLNITGLVNGARDMTIQFEILDGSGEPRITCYSAESNVSSTTQNGYKSSVLKDINIGSDGTVSGVFESGQVQPLAQLALASFLNIDGLLKVKGATFVSSGASGEPSIGVAGTGGRGTLAGASLEQSNVDIAREFTDMIIAQRGYQANSRVVTTTDELYQDTINLKR